VVVAVAVLCIVAVLVLYLWSTAKRLDRLHARIDAAAGAFDGQLRRRSAEVAGFIDAAGLDAASRRALRDAVAAATAVTGLGHDRELVESGITRALVDAAERSPRCFRDPSAAALELHNEALRASFARTFYNDTVRDALAIRDRRTVRWLRLAGRAPHPAYFEMDDEDLPAPQIAGPSGESPLHARPTIEV
jgi:hypothetical protein